MEKILLVEPYYQNKYPPMGLMKIATFHRERGDIVEFYKGEAPYIKISQMDRIYITTLFTFHYDITVKCIQHYSKYINNDCIYIGGIAANLLASDYLRDTGIENIICGQLTDSRVLGYDEKVNIDLLPLDYDILDDVLYKYPAGDNYFVHTTRGCPRACDFCAVKTLEPTFKTTNNVINQVSRVDAMYGQKRNLLIMDNNILYSQKLCEIVNDIRSLGFTGESNYVYPNPFVILMSKIRRRIAFMVSYSKQIDDIMIYLKGFSKRLARYEKANKIYNEIILLIDSSEDKWAILQKYESEITSLVEKYRNKTRMIRYVDFNQGIDARLIDADNAKILSHIPIRPFRLAYDGIYETEIFTKATKIAVANNICNFSNYILYNWKDRPEDLWHRLHNAILLYNSFDTKISAFSFPMKYAPVNEKDRGFIGEHWNKKYLGAVNVVLNVTKGVVARELDFFYEAFGANIKEYFMILTMPNELIRFRHFFRDNGLIDCWKKLYINLSDKEKNDLLDLLCKAKYDRSILFNEHSWKIKQILELYSINKPQFDRGERTASVILDKIKLYGKDFVP